jgi:hypothetical protein
MRSSKNVGRQKIVALLAGTEQFHHGAVIRLRPELFDATPQFLPLNKDALPLIAPYPDLVSYFIFEVIFSTANISPRIDNLSDRTWRPRISQL